MATRARIGIQLDDNSVLSVYHHWDGYPQWLGRILKTHYNTREQVAELIDGGDMSTCWTDKVWGKDRTDGQKYGQRVNMLLSIILPVVKIVLLVLIPSLNILTKTTMKSMLTFGR